MRILINGPVLIVVINYEKPRVVSPISAWSADPDRFAANNEIHQPPES